MQSSNYAKHSSILRYTYAGTQQVTNQVPARVGAGGTLHQVKKTDAVYMPDTVGALGGKGPVTSYWIGEMNGNHTKSGKIH